MEGSKLEARAICNPASSGGGYDPTELRREIEGYELEWITTQSPGDAREAAKEWRDGLLIVVGGDGTISEVVNGLGQAGFPAGVTLAILPAGTGNDLAATLAIPEDPDEARSVLRQNRVRTLDMVRVRSEGSGEQFFINVATGGMGAEVSGAADGMKMTTQTYTTEAGAKKAAARAFRPAILRLANGRYACFFAGNPLPQGARAVRASVNRKCF